MNVTSLNKAIDPTTSAKQDAILAALGGGGAETEKTPVKLVKAVTTASTAVPLVAAETFAVAVYIQAKKVAGDNTGNIFLGLSDLDQGVAELIEVAPLDPWELVMPAGTKVDLNKIYIDADTNGDGVVGYYIPA